MKEHLTSLREEYVDDVATTLRDVVRAESDRDSSLVDMCIYHLETGGKRLRATIPLAVGDSFGATTGSLIPFAAGCELLHNATLVHDDLQDGDETRRNRPTVWRKYGAPEAINLGDAMLYWALACLDRLEVSDGDYRRCVRRFVRKTLALIDGQQREFELMESASPETSDYLKMVEGKTGGLFVLTIAGAAELSGAASGAVDALEEAGRHLGVLFQIQDDVLDLYGDKGRGEPGADLREGKVSALAVHHLDRAAREERDELLEVLDAERDEVDRATVETFSRRFRDSGALDDALAEIDRRRDLAAKAVARRRRDELRDLVEGLAELFVAPIDHLR